MKKVKVYETLDGTLMRSKKEAREHDMGRIAGTINANCMNINNENVDSLTIAIYELIYGIKRMRNERRNA